MGLSLDRTSGVHPLDALSAEEITSAVRVLREEQSLSERHRFVSVTLREPAKEAVLAHCDGDAPQREADIVVHDRVDNKTYEAVVSISDSCVRSWTHIPGVQPYVMLDEFEEAERVVRDSPLFQDALRKRGITEFQDVCIDPWSAGSWGADDRDRRIVRALAWMKLAGSNDNLYAHPIDNLVAIVDLNKMEVTDVEDYGMVPVPRAPASYMPEAIGPLRDDLRALEIHQPDGPSFELDGTEVRWQKWRFRVGFTQREGLVLHTVSYRDGDEERQILYRASLSSMVVPYGDPSPTQHRKNAFDQGEYGLGYLANSLTLGCDCLGEIRYLDATLCDSNGNPYVIPNAVCLHEEDDGLLWKHIDFRTEHAEVRRSRRLVVSFITTVANYEYAFYWRFYQDGTIEHDIKLTGIMTTGAVAPGENSPYGQLLNDEGLYSPIHQHFFNYRLDLDIDGQENAVYEVNTEAPPRGGDNPHGNAFRAVSTLLKSEKAARRAANPASNRYWKIANPKRLNRVGEAVAYRLIPQSGTLPYWTDDSDIGRRGGFAGKHLWITPNDPAELFAGGDYPNQNPGPDGLPVWTEQDRDLVDRDVVLWHSFGSHHVPRLEDWPVMPVQHSGFKLEPCGFFNENPALDVPAPEPGCATHGSAVSED